MTNTIKKLPSDLINKIAAGEVIERPASIVKELIDNAIDAEATKITISLEEGGIKKIEVKDNGVGISKKMLPLAFERHATSKISSIEDLNKLITMGFRGEALSTITSISEVSAVSSVDGKDGNSITFDNSTEGVIKPAPREVGTTITVTNLFEKIPARFKFLKTATTEYRKVLEVLTPYFLIYPGIHFILEKDEKNIYNLSTTTDKKTPNIELSRASEVLKSEFLNEPIKLFYSGAGVEISGYIAHPSYHNKRVSDQYIFVNDRPIIDKGVYKAIHNGYERFIPHGEKVPFIINIKISPDLVDINVHPRKEEVRFINPYRMFSAVQESVKKALEKVTQDGLLNEFTPSTNSNSSYQDNAFSRLRGGMTTTNNRGSNASTENISSYRERETGNNLNTQLFSNSNDQYNYDLNESDNYEIDDTEVKNSDGSIISTSQLFKKYILVEFESLIWLVDQHAAAERITFERLLEIDKDKNADVQQMLVPVSINMQKTEIEYLREYQEFFQNLGFEYDISKDGINVTAIPSEYTESNINNVFSSIFNELGDQERDLKANSQNSKENILATIACHSSIRAQQRLTPVEQKALVMQLIACQNPYSCPHGRPIVWKQTLTQLDKNFDRTY